MGTLKEHSSYLRPISATLRYGGIRRETTELQYTGEICERKVHIYGSFAYMKIIKLMHASRFCDERVRGDWCI